MSRLVILVSNSQVMFSFFLFTCNRKAFKSLLVTWWKKSFFPGIKSFFIQISAIAKVMESRGRTMSLNSLARPNFSNKAVVLQDMDMIPDLSSKRVVGSEKSGYLSITLTLQLYLVAKIWAKKLPVGPPPIIKMSSVISWVFKFWFYIFFFFSILILKFYFILYSIIL